MGQSIECGTIYRLVSVTGPETVSYSYGDNRFPQLATAITDGNGKSVTIAYDDTGNATTVTSPRGTDTVYTYNYSGFPLGRVTSIKEGTKPTTTISYTSGGLVQSVTYPKPGTTDGSMVTASFSYDSLGNVSTVTAPGPLGDVTTTYDYGPSPKVGQPITITDSLGHATHLTYDARGNVTSATDALGNQTQFEYNVADQVLKVIHPATP
jgi:YD repeat-containing protein